MGPLYPAAMTSVQRRNVAGRRTVLALLGLAVAAGGCARNSVEIGVTTRAKTYEGFGDPMELVTADPAQMAVLPALTSGGGGGRTDATNMSMNEALDYDFRPFMVWLLGETEKHEITVVRFDVVVNTCIAAQETATLETVMTSLQQSGIPDREAIRRLGDLLDVEYFLVPKLVSLKTDDAGRFTFTGLTLVRTGWISVEAAMQLWDAPTGELVWQSTGEGSLTAENVVGISPSVKSALDGMMITLFGDFITGRTEAVVRTSVQNTGSTSTDPSQAAPAPVTPTPSPESSTTPEPIPAESVPGDETSTPASEEASSPSNSEAS